MKFSIRDLFLVTLIVAIAVLVLGWANEWFAHSVTRQTLESLFVKVPKTVKPWDVQ